MCVVMRRLKWRQKEWSFQRKQNKSAKVKSIQVMCALYTGQGDKRGTQGGRGGGGESNMSTTSSSCVPAGSLLHPWAFLREQLWRGCPATWPEVRLLGHLGAKFAGCD